LAPGNEICEAAQILKAERVFGAHKPFQISGCSSVRKIVKGIERGKEKKRKNKVR